MSISSISLRLAIIGTVILSGAAAYTLGRFTTQKVAFAEPASPTALMDPVPTSVPVVRIDSITNGMAEGAVSGDVRFVIGDTVITTDENGAFSVKADALLTNIITIQIPEGMQYVASKRGKYYYPVDSSAAEKLSLDTRVYFATEEEAERAGFISR